MNAIIPAIITIAVALAGCASEQDAADPVRPAIAFEPEAGPDADEAKPVTPRPPIVVDGTGAFMLAAGAPPMGPARDTVGDVVVGDSTFTFTVVEGERFAIIDLRYESALSLGLHVTSPSGVSKSIAPVDGQGTTTKHLQLEFTAEPGEWTGIVEFYGPRANGTFHWYASTFIDEPADDYAAGTA